MIKLVMQTMSLQIALPNNIETQTFAQNRLTTDGNNGRKETAGEYKAQVNRIKLINQRKQN